MNPEHNLMKLPALTFLLAMCVSAAAQEHSGLRAGTAVADISPTVFPIQLRSGPSDYVHDPLHVRAVAFENGEGRAVIALVDAIGVGREMADEAKAVAARKTGWKPAETFQSGIRKTVQWYLDNDTWVQNVQSGEYREWIRKNYEDRGA